MTTVAPLFSFNAVTGCETPSDLHGYVQSCWKTCQNHQLRVKGIGRYGAGTCNFFQVTGQIATIQWGRGPDSVKHVNEG